MNALELLSALEKSGTGAQKMHAARAVARDYKMPLREMDAHTLVECMKARYQRYRDVMDAAGSSRQYLSLPAECLPSTMWPEGTIAKAERILMGLPADVVAGPVSSVYDIDEKPPEPVLMPANPEPEDEPATPPGIHAGKAVDMPSDPGVVRKRGPGRPRKDSFVAPAEALASA